MKRQRPDKEPAKEDYLYHLQNLPALRRLKVPTNIEEWNAICQWDAYVKEQEQDLLGGYTRCVRPLALSSTLVSTAAAQQGQTALQQLRKMPLLQPLQHLLKPVAEEEEENPTTTTNNNEAEELINQPSATTTTLDAIDDPTKATLTAGQQDRYFLLKQKSSSSKRQEWRGLVRRVQAEQVLYLQALHDFFNTHGATRFSVGLETGFAQVGKREASDYRDAWMSDTTQLPHAYGTCRQVVSLQPFLALSLETTHRRHRRHGRGPTLQQESIQSRIVGTTPTVRHATLVHAPPWTTTSPPSNHSPVPPVNLDLIPPTSLLQHDSKALDLAQEYKADIITTYETLTCLLQLPTHTNMVEGVTTTTTTPLSQWSIPMVKDSKRTILELPLPQPATPRHCLERGIQQGLIQSLLLRPPPAHQQENDTPTRTTTTTPICTHYVYTLLTLPTNGKPKAQLNVLVRVPTPLWSTRTEAEAVPTQHDDDKKDKDDEMPFVPIRVLCHVEYFHDRGWRDKCTSYDRARWILEQRLLPMQGTRIQVAHVAAPLSNHKVSVLEWQSVSLVHALAAPEQEDVAEDGLDHVMRQVRQTHALDPMHHWDCMVKVLSSTLHMPEGKHLLQCCEASVSVHQAMVGEPPTDKKATAIIDMQEVFQRGQEVDTSPAALWQCVRLFEWADPDRAPYTFPVAATASTVPTASKKGRR